MMLCSEEGWKSSLCSNSLQSESLRFEQQPGDFWWDNLYLAAIIRSRRSSRLCFEPFSSLAEVSLDFQGQEYWTDILLKHLLCGGKCRGKDQKGRNIPP